MRAQFIRGGDPKETMDIGAYRTDAPNKDIFKRMHDEASKSKQFTVVTPIRWEAAEPSFKITSREIAKKDGVEEVFTIYLTETEGIILFKDSNDEEFADINFKEFLNITKARK